MKIGINSTHADDGDSSDEVILLLPKPAAAARTDGEIELLPRKPAIAALHPFAHLWEDLRAAVNAVRVENGLPPVLPADGGGSRSYSGDACVRCGAKAQTVRSTAPSGGKAQTARSTAPSGGKAQTVRSTAASGGKAQTARSTAPGGVDASVKLCSHCSIAAAGKDERWKGWLPW